MSGPHLLVAALAALSVLSAGCSATTAAKPSVAFAVPEGALSRTRAGDEGSLSTRSDDAAPSRCHDMTPNAAFLQLVTNKKHRLAYVTSAQNDDDLSSSRGGVTKSRPRFDEEVLVLSQTVTWTSATNQAKVAYEVLRWDGTCAAVSGDALSFTRAKLPLRPLHIDRLELTTQVTLLEDKQIHAALDRAEAACGAGSKSHACDASRRALGAVVAARAPRLLP